MMEELQSVFPADILAGRHGATEKRLFMFHCVSEEVEQTVIQTAFPFKSAAQSVVHAGSPVNSQSTDLSQQGN